MHNATLALMILLAVGLRIVAITLAVVLMLAWLATRVVWHLWAFAWRRRLEMQADRTEQR